MKPFKTESPFRWTLFCLDNNTSLVLDNSPIGCEELISAIATKQDLSDFKTELIFHIEGGGCNFVETICRTFDINGTLELRLDYSPEGRPVQQAAKPLFVGLLQLYTYHSTGHFTKLLLKAK